MITETVDPDQWIHIDVNKRVTKEGDERFLRGDEWKSTFVEAMFNIEGVMQVNLKTYTIVIKKGRAFAWEEILPSAVNTINEHLDSGGKLIRLKSDAEIKEEVEKKKKK